MSVIKLAIKAALMTSVVAMPTVANAADASRLSVQAPAASRASAEMDAESRMGGGFLIPLLALGAIVLGILVLLDDDDEDTVSP